MNRRTSVAAYTKIKDQGLLSTRRFQAYEALYHHGPLTAAECWKKCPGAQIDSIRPRMAELRDLGVIVEVGEKECSVTGMRAILWDVTEALPKKLDKKPSTTAEIKRLLIAARDLLKWSATNIRTQVAIGRPISEPGLKWLQNTEKFLAEADSHLKD